MAPTFTASNVVQEGNSLALQLTFRDDGYNTNRGASASFAIVSSEYLINCLVAFQAKVVRYQRNILYLIRFIAKRDIAQLTYTLDYRHKIDDPMSVDSEQCYIKNNRWQVISDLERYDSCTFYVSMKLSVTARLDPFERLHNDTELTDFELRGKDGSVPFHKSIAAGFSPVIKTGFTGEWGKEAKCVIDAPPGTTKQTLQHLKDYMYSDTLPKTGLKELLLLASFYIMPDLELRCVLEMLTNVTSEDTYQLFEFAMKHQMSQLMFEIMHRVQIGQLDADAIRKQQKW